MSAGGPWGTDLADPHPELIAPGSATHRTLGDAAVGVYALALFALPLLHPATAAATGSFDAAFTKPDADVRDFLIRFRDTVELIGGVVYAGPDGQECAHAIRELHRDIAGETASGARYHAWTREIWTWNWAAITAAVLAVHEAMRGRPGEPERSAAYAGMVEVGRTFAVRGMPVDRAEFDRVWPDERDRIADPGTVTLRHTTALVTARGLPAPASLRWLPLPVWAVLTAPLRSAWRVSLRVALPTATLAALDLTPGPAGRAEIALHRAAWRAVPRRASLRLGLAYFAARTRWGNPVWRRHFSRSALAARRAAPTPTAVPAVSGG